MLLVSSLCIIVCCIRRYKRKKPVQYQPRFKPSMRVYAGNARYIYEIENTEATTEVETKMCKWQ